MSGGQLLQSAAEAVTGEHGAELACCMKAQSLAVCAWIERTGLCREQTLTGIEGW